MAHQLLLHFEWSARSIEPRTIGVPKCVPANLRPDSGGNGGLLKRFFLNLLLMVRPASLGVRKQPIIAPLKRCLLSPFLKDGRQLMVEWNNIAGVLRLDVTNSTVNDAALD